MPAILVRCPCGREFATNETMVGSWLRCPDCGNVTLVTWPKRRIKRPSKADDIPPDEPLFDTPPPPEALDEMVRAEDEDVAANLTRTHCVACGRKLRKGRAVCPRCRTHQLTGGPVVPHRPRPATPSAPKPVRLPLAVKVVLGNVPFALLTVYVSDLAVAQDEPLLALGAILCALVPIVTLQAVVLHQVGRVLRVKAIGLEPAAHAVVLAAGVQLLLGVIGYLAVLMARAVGGPAAAQVATVVTLAVLGAAGLVAITRTLRIGVIRGMLLTGTAVMVLALGASVLEPVCRLAFAWVPEGLLAATQPAVTTAPATSQPSATITQPTKHEPAHPDGDRDAPADDHPGGGGGT